MEFADLRTLLVVSQEGSFSRAADLLHRTQPAVSLAVRRLEQRVGASLFDRETKRPVLTDAGRVLVGYAREMAALEGEARAALADLRELRRGDVTISVEEAITGALLPLVGDFRHRHPGIRVGIASTRGGETLARVARGDVDFGALDADPDDERFEATIIASERLVVAAPPGHRFAARASLAQADLGTEPLVVLSESSEGRSFAPPSLDRHRASGRVGLTLPSVDAIKRAVEQGLGVAILPACAVAGEVAERRLAAIALRDESACRPVWLVRSTRHTASAAAAALFDLARRRGTGSRPRAVGTRVA